MPILAPVSRLWIHSRMKLKKMMTRKMQQDGEDAHADPDWIAEEEVVLISGEQKHGESSWSGVEESESGIKEPNPKLEIAHPKLEIQNNLEIQSKPRMGRQSLARGVSPLKYSLSTYWPKPRRGDRPGQVLALSPFRAQHESYGRSQGLTPLAKDCRPSRGWETPHAPIGALIPPPNRGWKTPHP